MQEHEIEARARELEREFPRGVRGYRFKRIEEAGWFVLVAVVTVLAQELLTFDGTAVLDWRTWAVALCSALVRGAAGAMLAWFGKQAIGGKG